MLDNQYRRAGEDWLAARVCSRIQNTSNLDINSLSNDKPSMPFIDSPAGLWLSPPGRTQQPKESELQSTAGLRY
jgi:hypothetical protein